MTSWPAATSSPGLTRKLTMVASAMDSPNWGMTMESCFISHSQQVARGGADAARGGPVNGPKIGVVGNGRVFRVEALRRSVQQVKSLAGDARDDFGGHPAPRKGFPDAQQPPGARHRGDHRVGIQR